MMGQSPAQSVRQTDDGFVRCVFDLFGNIRRSQRAGYVGAEQLLPADPLQAQSRSADDVAVAQPDPGEERRRIMLAQGLEGCLQMLLERLPPLVLARGERQVLPGQAKGPLPVS